MTKVIFVITQTVVIVVYYYVVVGLGTFEVVSFETFEKLIYWGPWAFMVLAASWQYFLGEEQSGEVRWQLLGSIAVAIFAYYLFLDLEMVPPTGHGAYFEALGNIIVYTICGLLFLAWWGRGRNRIRFAFEIVGYTAAVLLVQEIIFFLVFRGQ